MASTSKFNNFHSKDFAYKIVTGHPIEATVCVPKRATPGKLPVLVHLHGGCLVVGDKMYEDWCASWLIQFAESKGAIIVSPNYRLLPEATGNDIIDDLTSFYDWIETSLSAEVYKISSDVEADLANILVAGESAGGYLAVQSALHFPGMAFSAIISQYGMIDFAHPHFSQPGHKDFLGTPDLPESTVDDYLKSIKPGAVRSSSVPEPLWPFIVACCRQGRLTELLGKDKGLYPVDLLDDVQNLPPFWIFHGTEDEIVPTEVSENFVNKLKKTHPQTPLLYTLQPGGHGFDVESTLNDAWVKEGCDFVSKYWH